MLSRFSCVWLLSIPWTIANQAPPSMSPAQFPPLPVSSVVQDSCWKPTQGSTAEDTRLDSLGRFPSHVCAWGQKLWALAFWQSTPITHQHCPVCICMPWSKILRSQKYTLTVKGPKVIFGSQLPVCPQLTPPLLTALASIITHVSVTSVCYTGTYSWSPAI